jgi:hypothetical protein
MWFITARSAASGLLLFVNFLQCAVCSVHAAEVRISTRLDGFSTFVSGYFTSQQYIYELYMKLIVLGKKTGEKE